MQGYTYKTDKKVFNHLNYPVFNIFIGGGGKTSISGIDVYKRSFKIFK